MSFGRVLVAGASGGIGRAVLAGIKAAGAERVGAHHNSGKDRLVPLLSGWPQARAFPADLARAETAAGLVAAFADWAGGIDVLVQLTGGASPAPIESVTPEAWRADLELNLTAPFFLAREAMKRMGKGGRIVLCSTASAAHGGGADTLAYGAAKAGLECVVKGLARAGAARGLTVNAVCPGYIDTGLHARMGHSAEQIAKRAELVPLKRAGTPAEAAEAVLFLASERAAYITGQCLAVSGGDWL